jgi:hypothetical protein
MASETIMPPCPALVRIDSMCFIHHQSNMFEHHFFITSPSCCSQQGVEAFQLDHVKESCTISVLLKSLATTIGVPASEIVLRDEYGRQLEPMRKLNEVKAEK